MTTASSIVVGLLIGLGDAFGFLATVRSLASAGAQKRKRILAITFEISRIALLCMVLILLCVKAHFSVAWLLGSALFVSFLGKVILAVKKPVPGL